MEFIVIPPIVLALLVAKALLPTYEETSLAIVTEMRQFSANMRLDIGEFLTDPSDHLEFTADNIAEVATYRLSDKQARRLWEAIHGSRRERMIWRLSKWF